MSDKQVWIRNNKNASVVVKTSKGESVGFDRMTVSKTTGQIESTGYTSVSEEIFEDLYKSSKIFKSFIDSRQLEKFDEAPLSALTATQRSAQLNGKLSKLEKEIKVLEDEKKSVEEKSAKDIAELTKQLEKAKEDVADRDTAIAELQKQVAVLTAESEQKKQSKKKLSDAS